MADNKIDFSYESILQQASKQKKGVFSLSKTYPAYIILLVTILASIAAWYLMDQKVRSDGQQAFDKAVTSVMTRLNYKFQDDKKVHTSMNNLYFEHIEVNRDIFELNASIPIRAYPSILTIAYAPYVENSWYDDFVYYVRSEGYYDFQLRPDGVRPFYMPIEYIVPLEKNMHRHGTDYATDSIAWNAIIKARDSNMTVATEVYTIRQPDTSGFYLISPVYYKDSVVNDVDSRRRNYLGALLLEIDSPVFFKMALGSGVASDTSITFRVIDLKGSGDENIVYESENIEEENKGSIPLFMNDKVLKVADRNMLVRFASIPDFGGSFQQSLPYVILAISLLISFAFFGFVLSVITRKARAVELAERMTRSQRRIVESSKDIISVLDMQGNWKSMNPASETIFELDPAQMIGDNIDKLFIDDDDRKKFASVMNGNGEEQTIRQVYLMKSVSGENKWIDWSFTYSAEDELIYCIGRDVTLEKLAEEEAKLRRKQNQLADQFTREASAFKSYFMIKLSHQLRNSLTGIVGYLQLLSAKIWDSEEEHDLFVSEAEKSSEELFTFVSDIDDVASASDEEESAELSLVKMKNIISESQNLLGNKFEKQEIERQVDVQLMDEGGDPGAVADKARLTETFSEIYYALSEGKDKSMIQVTAQENPYEGATEIQIFEEGNELVEGVIEVYKKNINSLIDGLKEDKKDILLRLSKASSNIRMMNGTIKVETFGGNEGNLVMITLPLNKAKD